MRLRRAMTILHLRCGRLAVVLDGAYNSLNQQATIRTAEAMGVQHVFIVDSGEDGKHAVDGKLSDKVTKGSYRWLTVRRFQNAEECIQHLRQQGWHVRNSLAPFTCLAALFKSNRLALTERGGGRAALDDGAGARRDPARQRAQAHVRSAAAQGRDRDWEGGTGDRHA